jgi:hypothetical protein
MICVRALHYVHEMNASRAGYVCPFVRCHVRMIQVEKHWTDLDEIFCERCAIGDYRKIVLLGFMQSVVPTWRANVKWG